MTRTKRNLKPRPRTRQEQEDARDLAYIKRASRKPSYSWNDFMKALGFDDLVTPRKRRS